MSTVSAMDIYKAIEFLIKVESGPDQGKGYRIFPPSIEIGRDPALQIVLTDPRVSRKQCAIIFTDNIYLQDLSSRRSTTLNGESVGKAILKPGDTIEFGDTVLRFVAKSKQEEKQRLKGKAGQPALGGAPGAEPAKRKNVWFMFVGVILALVAGLMLIENAEEQSKPKLSTAEELQSQIENSEERRQKMKEAYDEKRKTHKKGYLFAVEQHFIRGFRDFQHQQFSRAIQAFGTTVAADQEHSKAFRYRKLAQKQKSQRIDRHMRDGQKYRAKKMYARCAAEFKKALVLINDTNDPKYKLARAEWEECDLVKTEGL